MGTHGHPGVGGARHGGAGPCPCAAFDHHRAAASLTAPTQSPRRKSGPRPSPRTPIAAGVTMVRTRTSRPRDERALTAPSRWVRRREPDAVRAAGVWARGRHGTSATAAARARISRMTRIDGQEAPPCPTCEPSGGLSYGRSTSDESGSSRPYRHRLTRRERAMSAPAWASVHGGLISTRWPGWGPRRYSRISLFATRCGPVSGIAAPGTGVRGKVAELEEWENRQYQHADEERASDARAPLTDH